MESALDSVVFYQLPLSDRPFETVQSDTGLDSLVRVRVSCCALAISDTCPVVVHHALPNDDGVRLHNRLLSAPANPVFTYYELCCNVCQPETSPCVISLREIYII